MRSLRIRDEATTAIVSFAVVIAIYAIAFAAFVNVLQAPAHGSRDSPALDTAAETGLVDILATSGYFVNGTVRAKAWQGDPDKITRFGLAQDGAPNLLDVNKMRNLTKGGMEAANNRLLDYEEARAAMGLGEFDFHLRTYPLFDALSEAGLQPVKGLEVAYVGNYTKQGGGGVSNYPVQYTSAVEDKGDHLLVNVTVTNNGTTDTMFQAEFSVPLDNGYLIDTSNTPLLAANSVGSHTFSLKLMRTADWDWAQSTDKKVYVKINDPSRKVADFNINLASYDLTSPAYPPATDHAAVTVDNDKQRYRTTQEPKLTLELWDGEGDDVNNAWLNLTVRNAATGAVVFGQRHELGGNNKLTLPLLPAGVYFVNASKEGDPRFNNTDWFQVIDGNIADFTSSGGAATTNEGPESKYERGLLVSLVSGWTNTTYDVGGGDVYPGLKSVMNNDLATNLTNGNIDVLIVGSEVDQTALTSNAAKDSIQQFVAKGGLLIVLGSLQQQVTWLQPLFHATLTTSGDSLGVPDPSHPILHSPQELDYQNYLDNGRTWEFNSDEDASHFTHVLTREGGNRQQDILAVSKPGHFGNGTIVLTAWAVFQLTQPQQDQQAQFLFYNFILQAWSGLYVDMGPSIPSHTEVASSSRMATAPSPVFPDERVLVRVLLYVFR